METKDTESVVMPLVALIGNPVEGFQVVGPFENETEAEAWAEANGAYLVTLIPPDVYEEPGGPMEQASDHLVQVNDPEGVNRTITIPQAQALEHKKLIYACDGDCGSQIYHLSYGIDWDRLDAELSLWLSS